MVNNNVEYVDLGPGYEGEDPELDFDPTEGKGGLVPLSVDSGAIKVNLGGNGEDGTAHDDYTYSGIIRNEQKFDFSIIVSYVRDYIPDSHQGKMIVQQATSMGLWLMRSRSLQRRRLLEGFEERASQWTRKMGRKADRESQLDQVDRHLAKWAKANMRQARIRVERLTYGLDFVDNDAYLQDWFLADREMREAVPEAIESLSTEGYQVFTAKMEMHRLLRQEMEDRAQHLPNDDLSDWLEAMRDSKTTQAHLLLGAPWIIQEAAVFAMENQGKNNPHKIHLERMQSGMIAAANPRGRSWLRSPAAVDGQPGALPAPAQTPGPTP